jgi:type I restriction enzyme M protein
MKVTTEKNITYQPPTPAKELLAAFWKLEKEAEKMLEGLAR